MGGRKGGGKEGGAAALGSVVVLCALGARCLEAGRAPPREGVQGGGPRASPAARVRPTQPPTSAHGERELAAARETLKIKLKYARDSED